MNNQWLEYSDPEKTTNEPVNTKSSFDAPPREKKWYTYVKGYNSLLLFVFF